MKKEIEETAQIEPNELLKDQERDVLNLTAEGRRNKEIASDLELSIKTVERYKHDIGMIGIPRRSSDRYRNNFSERQLQSGIIALIQDGIYHGYVDYSTPTSCNIPLSPAENEVMNLVCQGYGFEEIGEQRDKSPRTIEAQVKSVKKKLKANTEYEAVAKITALQKHGMFLVEDGYERYRRMKRRRKTTENLERA